MSKAPIRVLLVDDHELVRQGLIIFLKTANVAIVGEAGDGSAAVRLAGQLHPDVVLMDLVMPGMDGIDATRHVKAAHPEVEVLALTSYIDEEKVLDSAQRRRGRLRHEGRQPCCARPRHPGGCGGPGLSLAHGGQLSGSPRAAQTRAIPRPRRAHRSRVGGRTVHRRGLSNQAIAEDLQISPKTVKAHVGAILQKLHLENRTEVAVYALQRHLVQPD